jgi:hypothetical protein
MAYNKKDEDENTVVKVDRTSVFQEGKPPRWSTIVISIVFRPVRLT